MEIMELIEQNRVIAIVRGMHPDQMAPLARALERGGIRMMEITFNQNAPETFQNTVNAIRTLSQNMRDMAIGAGTVMTLEQLHMAADALVSVGVMVSGAVMMATGWYLIDPLVGLLVAAVIVWSTWGLLRDSLRLSLDGVPAGIDYDEVFRTVASQPGVSGVHHLHVWALSTTENALTAHVAVHDLQRMPQLKEALRARLRELGIDHATLEFESDVQPCGEHADCDMEQGRCGGASQPVR